MTLTEAADYLAPIIYKMVEKRRQTLDAAMQEYLRRTVKDMCRHMEHFCVPRVSVAAAKAAGNLDLRTLGWAHQTRHDPGRRRLHFDHMKPVAALLNEVLECMSDGEVATVLKTASVAWILKVEDDALTQAGFRYVRPDPTAAYGEVGIALIAEA